MMNNKNKNKKNTSGLKEFKILNEKTSFSVKEAYSTVRTNLLYSGHAGKCAIFAVCGASENAGKSLSCINLAVSFAQLGKSVLIIDADMRHPSIKKALRIKKDVGLSDVLARLTKEIPIISTQIKNLCLIPAGSIPPNPAELLCSSRFDKVLEACAEKFDYIFIDTPPVNLVSDAALLAQKVDGYIFIVRAGVDNKRNVGDAVDTLQKVDAKIIGFVLNDVNRKTAGYYAYGRYGKYGYGRYGRYGKYGYGKYYGSNYGYGYGYGYGYRSAYTDNPQIDPKFTGNEKEPGEKSGEK